MIILGNIRQHPDHPSVWVSNCGRVFQRVNETHPERHQWVERKTHSDKDGYLRAFVGGRNKLVHRLVYMLWGGDLKSGLVVCHIDGNNKNNHIANLVQASQRENIGHKIVHGTAQIGEAHPRAKINSEQAARIKQLLSVSARTGRGALLRGEAPRIAEATGVSIHIVRDIDRGRVWGHVAVGD